MDKKTRLIEIIRDRSFYNDGTQFTLTSGSVAAFYFDMQATMSQPEASRLIGQMMCERLMTLDVDMIGGLELGAASVATAVSIVSGAKGETQSLRPMSSFVVRKKAKDHGTKALIEGLAVSETLEGKNVVIVEDVATSGLSALKAVATVKEAGANVLMVLAVVDSGQGAKQRFINEAITFDSLVTTNDFRDSDMPVITGGRAFRRR